MMDCKSWTDEKAWLQARIACAIQHGFVLGLDKADIAEAVVRACNGEQLFANQIESALMRVAVLSAKNDEHNISFTIPVST